jgi:hypothetical protein
MVKQSSPRCVSALNRAPRSGCIARNFVSEADEDRLAT